MFKRIACFTLAMLMVIGLTACKNTPSEDSQYSVVWEEEIIGGEDVAVNNDAGSDGAGVTNNQSTTSNTPSIGNNTANNAEKMKAKLDFKGASITIMREWEPYANGRNVAWDNFNNWLAKCEKKFNVKIVEKKWKGNGLAAEMLAGVKPEGHYYLVGATGGGNIYDMATKGYLAYMDDAMKATGIDMTADHYNEYNTGVANLNGKQWTIGFGFARIASTVIYNKKLLAAAGYENATSVQSYIDSNKWNWDVMTEMAKKATVRNNSGEVTQYGIGITEQGIKGMILSNGGHIVHPDSNGKFTSQLNTENTKEAIQQVYDWYHVDKVANAFAGSKWTQMGESFANKKVAMIFGGHSEVSTAYSSLTGEDYGIAYLPMGPRMNKYVSYMTYEYSYVIPAAYQSMTTDLLLLADELHDWPVEGYTRDDEFRDEWTRYFHNSAQYTMWYNHHFSNKVQRVWDGSNIVTTAIDFDNIASSGSQTPAVWVDSNHKAVSTNVASITSKYSYTGKLK